MVKRPRVYGVRSCLQCKGICREGSLRKKVLKGYGFRSHYFCSKQCLENREELAMEKRARKSRLYLTDDYFKTQQWKEHMKWLLARYEKVDCITT